MSETKEVDYDPKPVSEARLKLLRAMFEARKEMKTVEMNGFNEFDKYNYSNLADYVTSIEGPCETHGLMITHDVVEDVELPTRKNHKERDEQVRRVKVRTTCTLIENGQSLFTEFACEGMDPRDKANLKANTGAKKYALANLFNLKSGIDPESVEDGRNAPAGSQQRNPPNGKAGSEKPPAGRGQQRTSQSTFAPPPNWPDKTTVEQMKKWIDGLAISVTAFKVAWGILFSNETLRFQGIDEWEPVLAYFKVAVKHNASDPGRKEKFLAGMSEGDRLAFFADVKKESDRVDLEKQSRGVFGGDATAATPGTESHEQNQAD